MKHAGNGGHTARAKLGRLGVGALSIVFALSQALGLVAPRCRPPGRSPAAEPRDRHRDARRGRARQPRHRRRGRRGRHGPGRQGIERSPSRSRPTTAGSADSLTTFAGDGSEAAKIDVEDGRATFKAETDTTVTCAFYEDGSNGSAALEAVATEASAKQAKEASDKAYIEANLDESLSASTSSSAATC